MYYNLLIGGTLYTDVKSFKFAPEFDPTCASLPICEFEAEFKTTVPASAFMGSSACMVPDYNGNNTRDSEDYIKVGGYNIEEVRQLSPDIVYICARSWLSWLDKRVLAGEYFNNVNAQTFVYRLFKDTPVNDGAPIWPDDGTNPPIYIYYYYAQNRTVTGYCPEQTARERLQWLCQAWMMKVEQWGSLSETAILVQPTPDNPDGTKSYYRINPEYTYSKPTIRKVKQEPTVVITAYDNFTTTFHDESGWGSVVTGYEYELTEDGVIPIEKRLYFQKHTHKTESNVPGEVVTLEGNMLLLEGNTSVLNAMPATFMRDYEVELECLQLYHVGHNDHFYFPGDLVEFYTDPQTMYKGIVKSASFTFGLLAKAKLVISTDLIPEEMAHIIIKSVYNPSAGVERLLCVRHYWINQSRSVLTVENKQMREYVSDRLERFNPSSSESTFSLNGEAEQTYTVKYNRA